MPPVGTCTRAALIEEALSWQGTKYHNHAALKGVGCDCIGLLIGVAKQVGLLDPAYDPGYYSADWHLHKNEERLLSAIEAFGCLQVPFEDRLPGDIALFQFGRVCAHSALLVGEDELVHAVRDFGKVVITSLRGEWQQRLRRVYRFPGVA